MMWGVAGGFMGAHGFNTPDDGPNFTFEALTGMRAWTVTDSGRLTSPIYRQHEWTPGTNEATHNHPQGIFATAAFRCDPCPTRTCSAGFYAYHSEGYWYANDLDKSGYTAWHPWVSGLIAGWGRVVNGPKGFRCAKATILALCLPIQQPDRWENLPGVKSWGSWEGWADFAADRIQAAFPSVPIFASVEDMLARIPLQGAA